MKPARESLPSAELIARECVAVRLRMLNRSVSAVYDEALRPHGLRVGQLNLLVAIARLGRPRPGQLCGLLRMEKSTLSRDLDLLRRNRWIKQPSARGARSQPLELTAAGQALLDSVLPAWKQAQQKAKRLLGSAAFAAIAGIGLEPPAGTAEE